MTDRPDSLTVDERRVLRDVRPETPAQLRAWLRLVLGLRVPDRPIDPAHSAPLDYLAHAFFDDRDPRDCVVWANRGGGKTFYAAVATALDLVFKPGVEVMILGGSLQQSQRVLAHLRRCFESDALAPLVRDRLTERRVALINGSVARVLAQSHTSVRGARPQIIRCDEAELFDPDIWRAAQLVTRSETLGGRPVRGAVEALSTWRRVGGLMDELVAPPRNDGDPPTRRLFRWNAIDAVARCEPERPCEPCPLLPECARRAKRARGHQPVDDLVAMKARADDLTWQAEMLCSRPITTDAVYPGFSPDLHVAPFPDPPASHRWVGGVDFGFRNPTVVLWAALAPDGALRVVDERVERETTLDRHIEAVRDAPWPAPEWFGVDPAGRQRSDQTGLSPIAVLRRAGLAVRARRVPLADGLRAVRARLEPAHGAPTLLVHPRCRRLIHALRAYRFARGAPSLTPLKDGADHPADALRYLVQNLDLCHDARRERYI